MDELLNKPLLLLLLSPVASRVQVRYLWKKFALKKLLMLCARVYFTSGSSALLGRPGCGLSIWLSLLAIFNTLFWVYANLFHEKTDKTREYSKSVIFVWYENGRRRLLGAQSINCLSEVCMQYLSDERPKFALSFGISPMNGRNLDYRSRSFVIHLMDGRSSHSRSGSIRWMAEV